MKYFARIDRQQKGPFSLRELLEAGIRPETYVWARGMDDWTRAEDVPDICRGMRRMLAGLDPETGASPEAAEDKSTSPGSESAPADDPSQRIIFFGSRLPDNAEEFERMASRNYSVPPAASMILAIISTILCCPLTGIAAIYLSMRVKSLWKKSCADKMPQEERTALRKKAYQYARNYNMMIGITICLWFFIFGMYLYRHML